MSQEKLQRSHEAFLVWANIYLLNGNNISTRKMCEICSKSAIKTTERYQLRRSCVFTVNFEHLPHLSLVLILLIFEYVFVCWEVLISHFNKNFLYWEWWGKTTSLFNFFWYNRCFGECVKRVSTNRKTNGCRAWTG